MTANLPGMKTIELEIKWSVNNYLRRSKSLMTSPRNRVRCTGDEWFFKLKRAQDLPEERCVLIELEPFLERFCHGDSPVIARVFATVRLGRYRGKASWKRRIRACVHPRPPRRRLINPLQFKLKETTLDEAVERFGCMALKVSCNIIYSECN